MLILQGPKLYRDVLKGTEVGRMPLDSSSWSGVVNFWVLT